MLIVCLSLLAGSSYSFIFDISSWQLALAPQEVSLMEDMIQVAQQEASGEQKLMLHSLLLKLFKKLPVVDDSIDCSWPYRHPCCIHSFLILFHGS